MVLEKAKKRLARKKKKNLYNIIQNVYIMIFDKTYKFTSKMNEKQREICSCLLVAIMAIGFIYNESYKAIGFATGNLEKQFILGMFLFAVAALSVKDNLKIIKLNKLFVDIYYITLGLIFLFSIVFRQELSYVMLAINMIFMFPAVFFVWGNRNDFEKIFNHIARVFCYVFIGYFAILFLMFSPEVYKQVNGAYLGSASNQNSLAILILSAGIFSLYLYLTERRPIMPIIVFIIAFNIALITDSRTVYLSFLAMILTGILILVYRIVVNFRLKNKAKVKFNSICLTCLIIALSVGAVVTDGLFNITYVASATEETETLEEETESQLYTEINRFSSGRIVIWEYCIENSQIIGGSKESGVEVNGSKYNATHNTIVEYTYRSGFIVGILMMILFILHTGYSIERTILSYGEKGLLPLISLIAYIPLSMFEIAWNPAARGAVLIFFLGMSMTFLKDPKGWINQDKIKR